MKKMYYETTDFVNTSRKKGVVFLSTFTSVLL